MKNKKPMKYRQGIEEEYRRVIPSVDIILERFLSG